MTPPILLTGFQPFAGDAVNPTALLMDRLAGEPGLVTAVLPVVYTECGERFAALLEEHEPMAALAFGMARRTDFLLIERIAWNRDESEAADNAGVVHEDQPIAQDGPTAYGSSIPVPLLLRALAGAGLPVSFSDHAGGFVCNHLFYAARHRIETSGLDVPMAFIHVPPLPEQVAEEPTRRGMPLDRLVLAANAAVDTIRRALLSTTV